MRTLQMGENGRLNTALEPTATALSALTET